MLLSLAFHVAIKLWDFSRAEICKIGIDWCNKLDDPPDSTNVVVIIDNLNGLGLSPFAVRLVKGC